MAAKKEAFPLVKKGEKYARDVVAGRLPACLWMRLACKRHLDDVKASKAKDYPYKFDAAKAERYMRFVQMLPHTKGKWAQDRITYEPWQIFCFAFPFGWIRKADGLRRFRLCYYRVPRKNGKSLVASATGLYMFTADGEAGAEVYSGATTEKQAWEVFRPARTIVKRTQKLKDRFGIEVNAKTLIRTDDGSRFEPIIGNPHDGASPSCSIVDEYHEHPTSDLFDTMQTGMGARDQPMQVVITTAGSRINGPCHMLDNDCQKVLEGVMDNPELWACIFTIDKEDDWTTEEAFRKANPNCDISVGSDFLRSRLRDAKQSTNKQNVYKTKHLNLWVGARNAWMNYLKWSAQPQRKTLEELEGRDCFAAVDLASKIDIAAKGLLFPPIPGDPLWHFHPAFYIPSSRLLEEENPNAALYASWDNAGLLRVTDGEVIDFNQIQDDLRDDAARFTIIECAYDPWQGTKFATELADEGMQMVELGNQVKNLSHPMKEVEALVLAGSLAHGDCPIMNWMISNVVSKKDNKDNEFPVKESSDKKIDGPLTLFMAMNRALTGVEQQSLSGFLSDVIAIS